MNNLRPTVALIPARMASSRLPGKVLLDMDGAPVVVRVWESARQSSRIDRVLVCTDDERVAEAIRSRGGEAIVTTGEFTSGGDRVAHVARTLDAARVLNIQGDEPFVTTAALDALVAAHDALPAADIVTPICALTTRAELENPAIVKVVRTASGRALYFSRATIPYPRTDVAVGLASGAYWRHLGVYLYRAEFLQAWAAHPPVAMETLESLEQLRALDMGAHIQTVVVDGWGTAIDTPDDYALALAQWRALHS